MRGAVFLQGVFQNCGNPSACPIQRVLLNTKTGFEARLVYKQSFGLLQGHTTELPIDRIQFFERGLRLLHQHFYFALPSL